MKKQNLKSLTLNKKTISGFKGTVVGGRKRLTDGDIRICNLSIIDGSKCMSEGGCTHGPDETMTCAAWSCMC